MSFDQKKRSDIEVDELNIKSHLNTSLVTEEISVSEDLINRTLEAIRNNNDEDLEVKSHPVYMSGRIRTLVTVVAALLVLAVGINVIRLNVPMDMKSGNAVQDAKEYDMDGKTMKNEEEDMVLFETTEESADVAQESDSYDGLVQDGVVDSSINIDDSVRIGSYKSDTSIENEIEDEDSMEEQAVDKSAFTIQGFMTSFTDMVSIDSDSVTSITITSMVNNEERVITNQDQIKSFYLVMDSYSYQEGTLEDKEGYYIIDIISGDINSNITVRESNIIVELTDKDTASQGIYTVLDHSKFIEDLKNFMSE